MGIKGLFAVLLVLPACVSASAGVVIDFDYTYDQYGFFDDPARRELLEFSAAQVTHFIDDLDAIVPSGGDHWQYCVPRPDDPNWVFIDDDTIAADTVKVYVGGYGFWAGFHALMNEAMISLVSGSEDWEATIAYRGESGAADGPATDYGVFAGSIGYNTDINWHFGASTDGLDETKVDFLTVTMHELFHVLGMGPADSWKAQIVDGKFTGAEATAVGSSNNPEMYSDGGHWEEGTLSEVGSSSQVALLNPTLDLNQRRWPTALDRAALLDIGWESAIAGDVDLDRDVDISDIMAILAAGKFGDGPANATWGEGDVDGDLQVDINDIMAILAAGQFGAGSYRSMSSATAIVPEPSSMALLIGGAVGLLLLAIRRGVLRA